MAQQDHAALLAAIDAAAPSLADADEPEAIEEIRAALRSLVEGGPSARAEAYDDLATRFTDTCAAPLLLVPLLVRLAESLEDPARAAALGLLVGIGRSHYEEAPWLRDVDRAFASVAERLDRLAGFFGISARLSRRAAGRARGKRYSLGDVLPLLERVESALAVPAREQARRECDESLRPEALAEAARAFSVSDERSAYDAVILAFRCANAGHCEEALLVYEKLGAFRTPAEPARMTALVRLGRVKDARDAVLAITTAWLAPATSHRSVNQVLLKGDVRDMLRGVRAVIDDRELEDLARAVEAARVEPFIEMGTDSF